MARSPSSQRNKRSLSSTSTSTSTSSVSPLTSPPQLPLPTEPPQPPPPTSSSWSSKDIQANASKSLALLKLLNEGNYDDNNTATGPSINTTNTTTDDGCGRCENINLSNDNGNGNDNGNESSNTNYYNSTGKSTTGIQMRSRTSHATSWVLEQVRKSYRARLDTFADPSTYFAKPVDISPLVCARFGWSNTAPNVLTCTNNNDNTTTTSNGDKCCNAVLYVKFDTNLSPQSHSTLTQTYRRLLAESHSESCPFMADADRWLCINSDTAGDGGDDGDGDENDTKDNHPKTTNDALLTHSSYNNERTRTVSSFVPPYLLSMSREFTVLEDCSTVGFITRKFVRREATTLGIAMTIVERTRRRRLGCWRTVVPKEVIDHFADEYGVGTVRDDGDDGVATLQNSIQTKILACLTMVPGEDDDESQPPRNNEPNSTTITEKAQQHDDTPHNHHRYIRNESALLAVFGWRFDPWPSSPTITTSSSTAVSSRVLRVKCPLCLASEEIPWCVSMEDDSERVPTATTRNTTDDGKIDDTNTNSTTIMTQQQPPLKKPRKIPLPPPQGCDDQVVVIDVLDDVDPESSVPPSNQAQSIGKKGVQTDSTISTTADTATSVNSFDVLNSHRHFCPYVSGFSSHPQVRLEGLGQGVDATAPAVAVTGWRRVIDTLMRPRGGLEEGIGQDSLSLKKRSISREETFQLLRRALQS